MKDKENLSRRNFLGQAALVGAAGAIGASAILSSCSKSTPKVELNLPPLLDQAPDGKELKAGLIGCGGRGTGAALNFLESGPNVKIVALGDVFADRLQSSRDKLKKKAGQEIADDKCFIGFDAYQKVIDSGVDVVILATPPHFRPGQFDAAVQARKHVFMEKPVAVDPVGARQVMVTAKKAEALGLSVVTGTQRRHQRDYIEVYKRVAQGEIGEIVGGNCYWNGGKLWHRNPNAEWSEMEYMIRNWVNWCWLSGDHIVEQHVHNIDVINWFAGAHPTKAVGFGSRQRRVTGDQYDNFSVDFLFDNGMHVHSMCRQINGCTNNVSEYVRGTNGYTNCKNTIYAPDQTEKYSYEYPLNDKGESSNKVKISPYVQEHIDLVTSIRTGKPINEAENTAISTMCAIMGRISAYTGKQVTWDEVMNSDMKLGPKVYSLAGVDINKEIPVSGDAFKG
ncbi:Gfo/Idh/MocA family oxidoreductase [Puteibacter caeruleilacunae]|nr:Gfo/Idh/MocA family oxidoreductase [Puteibacter caeruleilacunae]